MEVNVAKSAWMFSQAHGKDVLEGFCKPTVEVTSGRSLEQRAFENRGQWLLRDRLKERTIVPTNRLIARLTHRPHS
jgi:hypothetical protein